jgi:hypothetical protein
MDEANLEPLSIGDIPGKKGEPARFWVPAYQRGYRWGDDQVRRLLQDIWDSKGEAYYLQPIVVKWRPDRGAWELIDGQQRLTTLFLIFQYMKDPARRWKQSGTDYELEYETRPGSADFLQQPTERLAPTNIDFHHIWKAYLSIDAWFKAHGNRAEHAAGRIYDYLLDPDEKRGVKIIWYEAQESLDSIELFTRLNVGRIALTDAELVKAFLLSQSKARPGHADRSDQIAAQWDAIERELREPEVWAFVTKKPEGEATHIELLLDTLADRLEKPDGAERPTHHTFETLRPVIEQDPQEFWDDVVRLHSMISGWYDDRDMYHKIGYLVAVGHAFADLEAQATGKTKPALHLFLDDLIRDSVGRRPGEHLTAAELKALDYEKDSSQAFKVLLLMNVETVRKRSATSERYSFRAHARGDWSLEHIHAQNAGEMKRDHKLWMEWLERQEKELVAVRELDAAIRQELVAEIADLKEVMKDENRRGGLAPRFNAIRARVEIALSDPALGADVNVHSISNLALLASGDNSALSNSTFAAKRREILGRDECGSYIPACTRNVFLKYYTKSEDQQFYYWSGADREDYLAKMISVLSEAKYLDDEGSIE